MKAVFAIASLLIVAGCARHEESHGRGDADASLPRPAAISEIGKAVFTISNQGVSMGKGVLVGFAERKGERLFFLTARHVVTAFDNAGAKLDLKFDSGATASIEAKKDRWRTTRREFDLAWLALSQSEYASLEARDALHYVPFVQTPIRQEGAGIGGTGAIELHRLAKSTSSARAKAVMFYKEAIMPCELLTDRIGYADLPFPHNRTLLKSKTLITTAAATDICTPGDSGGPVFVRHQIGNEDYWMLVGLVIGGNKDTHVNAIQPIDQLFEDLRHSVRRLIDRPEYW